MKHKVVAATLALNAVALVGGVANAQGGSAAVPQSVGHSYAGASFGSPLAFGADWGVIGAGVFGQTLPNHVGNTEVNQNVDGSAALVFGLGDADEYVGLETDVISSSLRSTDLNDHQSFGDSGGLNFKLHTNLPGGAAAAVGVNGTARWGDAKDQNKASVFTNVTKVFSIDTGSSRHALVANIGLGDNSFTRDIGDDGVNVFGGLAFYLTRQYSLIADYTGRFTNLAVSAAPFDSFPVVITLGAVNVGGRLDSNAQFAGSVGYAFSF